MFIIKMKNKKKNIDETKEKIIDALEGMKEFEVYWGEEVFYSKKFKAKSKEELEEQFYDGELEFKSSDIVDGNILDGTLEIEEVE